MAATFWFIGATTTIVLLPFDPPTAEIGDAGWGVAAGGVLGAFAIGYRRLNKATSIREIYLLSGAAVLLVLLLEWMAGGRSSPYHYLLILPLLYVSAAHSPPRVLGFAVFLSIVIWAPLLYEGTSRQIVLDVGTQLFMLLAVGAAVWGLFILLRIQREEIRAQRARAEGLAREDSLTGLGNRRAFRETLTREVARARRGDGRLSVVVGDLDHFKEINDRFGHEAGDECLRRTADALRSTARRADACFRWGGDEFAVLLPETDGEEAEAVAERIQKAVRASGSPSGASPLEITCGVAQLSAGGEPETLVAAADRDLLARKRVSLRVT